jgi:hypothetical protein
LVHSLFRRNDERTRDTKSEAEEAIRSVHEIQEAMLKDGVRRLAL